MKTDPAVLQTHGNSLVISELKEMAHYRWYCVNREQMEESLG